MKANVQGNLFPLEELEEEIDTEKLKKLWSKAVKGVKRQKPLWGTILEFGRPGPLRDGVLFVTFPQKDNFHREIFESEEFKEILEEELFFLTNFPLKVSYKIDGSRFSS